MGQVIRYHTPIKISRSDGTIMTTCIIDEFIKDSGGKTRGASLLETFYALEYFLDMSPQVLYVDDNVLIRTTRTHSHATPMNFLSYSILLIDRHMRIQYESSQYLEDRLEVFDNIKRKCIGERGVADLTDKIKLGSCLAEIKKYYEIVWMLMLEELRRHNRIKPAGTYALDSYAAPDSVLTGYDERTGVAREDTTSLGEGKDHGLRSFVDSVTSLWVLIEYSVFLRRFSLLYPADGNRISRLEFDMRQFLRNLLSRYRPGTRERDIVEWFILNTCCYSGISVYPLLIWFTTTFGTELPPGTIMSYEPSRIGYSPGVMSEPRYKLWIVDSPEVYGAIHPSLLERYTRFLDLDATLMSMAIDLFSSFFLHSPWIRAVVHSSFIRTLYRSSILPGGAKEPPKGWNWRGRPQDRGNPHIIVIPALYPVDLQHPKTRWIPSPIVSRVQVSPRLRELYTNTLQVLSAVVTQPGDVATSARIIMNLINEELKETEARITNRLMPVFEELYRDMTSGSGGKPCTHGLIVEVLHPFANYFLYDAIAERYVAYVPSPGHAINLIYILMNRLTESEYFKIQYYIILDSKQLIRDYRKFIELASKKEYYQIRSAVGDPSPQIHRYDYYIPGLMETPKTLHSYNLERISRAILAVEELDEADKGRLPCFENIIKVDKLIIEEAYWW